MKGSSGTRAPLRVRFENGNDALVVTDDDGADPRGLLATLELAVDDGRPVIVVCGGADELGGDALARAERVLGPAVAKVAQLTGAALVDGGTAAGVMEVMGKARAEGHNALSPLVGVAPAGKVTYPGDASAAGGDRTPLQANHTHFVLADSSTWGGETELLFDVAQAIAGPSRVAIVLAGGGSVALAEAREAVRRGWPVFVLTGTGGTADQLAGLWRAHRDARPRVVDRLLPRRLRRRAPELSSIADLDLREIVRDGDVRRIEEDDPAQVARRIAWEVQDEPVLKDAWQVFATYDGLATHMRRVFERFQGSILALGVLATLLALIHESLGGAALHWAVVAAPILASVLIAIANRRAAGKRWVLLRGGAEAIKAEIYRYRTRTGLYAQTQLPDQDPAKRPGVLADQLERITLQLVQTDVGGGAIPRYDGPLPPPMYGAGRDDDGLSAVDPDRYLRIRIGDQLAYYEGRVVRLARRRGLFQVLAIGAGGAGAILAAAGLEIWIGLTTAIAGSGIAYLAYLQVDATIVAYNQSATRLAALKREWDAHGAAERDAASFESLVSRGEAVLTTELGGWVQHMTEALRELQARQADAAREVEQQMATETPDEAEEGPGPAGEAARAAETDDETPPKGSPDGAAATGAPEEADPPAPATEAERAEGAETSGEGQRQD